MSTGEFFAFYHSQPWRITRKAYLKSVGGLCELCLQSGIYRPAVIVHHKVFINSKNLHNPEVTLNWSNLCAVCREHHERIHQQDKFIPVNQRNRRFDVGVDGSVILKDE